MTLEDLILELQTVVTDLRSSHADLQARVERTFRKGKVTDVDGKNHLYRQEVGSDDDGNPVKSPWILYSQVAGSRKRHLMPTVGEQFLMISPDGDPSQSLGIPHGWSDANPSPSDDPEKHVDVFGDVSIIEDGRSITKIVKGVTYVFSAAGLDVRGGKITHDGKDIGSDHTHSDVQPGGGNSGPPNAAGSSA